MSREVPLAGSPKGHCGCLVTSFKLPGHQSALGDRFYRSLHMSQNLEEVDFVFSERAMDEAICNLHNLGFCDQDPILVADLIKNCLLYTSPSPRDKRQSRMPSSA